jgi:AcrR family transcriptional regulator
VSRRDEVIDAAERVLEAEGPDAVTMRRLGEELGMRAPSLYKHVSGKQEIEAALQERALIGIAERLVAAGPGLAALAEGYRAWALAHPRMYELSARRPLQRDSLTPGVESAAAAPLMDAVGGDEHLARAVWAFAHGMVDLELADRFPPGIDVALAWTAGLHAFEALHPLP